LAVNDHYLIAFGGPFSWFDQNRASLSHEKLSQLMRDAKLQIRSLTAIGITEQFEQSVTMTPRLASAIEDLIAYDDELYGFAKSEFEQRLVELQGETSTPKE
jgi:hypothetical protein